MGVLAGTLARLRQWAGGSAPSGLGGGWTWPWSSGGRITGPLSASKLPAVGRALGLFTGLIGQMPLYAERDGLRLPTPRLLLQPDPNVGRSWFVARCVEDYLQHGNAVCVVAVRDPMGWPLAVVWIPAAWITLAAPADGNTDPDAQVLYFVNGTALNPGDVIHVRRGADRWMPGRGVGVVEQHLETWQRIGAQESYELSTLEGGAVPSVVITSPNPKVGKDEVERAKTDWEAKFSGKRAPVILPNGYVVTPLAWSPEDAQLEAARKFSLVDAALCYNLDPYWLGAPSAGMTYRTTRDLYDHLRVISLEPVLCDFRDAWSAAWLPRGQNVQFDTSTVVRYDLPTSVTTSVAAVNGGIWTPDEGRVQTGYEPLGGEAAMLRIPSQPTSAPPSKPDADPQPAPAPES